jgi:hypothetical protein
LIFVETKNESLFISVLRQKNREKKERKNKKRMKYCLVTVGTTEFRDLIKEIENQKFLNLLINQGFEKIFVQYGTGKPPKIDEKCGIELYAFDYMHGDEWKVLTKNAELIVSHAGAGSCLEALENKRKLLGKLKPPILARLVTFLI